MSIPEEAIERLFNFPCDTRPFESDLLRQSQSFTRTSAHQMARQSMQDELQSQINKLNQFIAPNKCHHHLDQPAQHKRILRLIDTKMHELFLLNANEENKARINSLQVTGALSYLDIPVNPHHGNEHANLEHLVMQSRITQKHTICRR